MACLKPDGHLTRCGEYMLIAMWKPATLENVSKECRVPLFRTRSAVREFLNANLLKKDGEIYVVSDDGIAKLEG